MYLLRNVRFSFYHWLDRIDRGPESSTEQPRDVTAQYVRFYGFLIWEELHFKGLSQYLKSFVSLSFYSLRSNLLLIIAIYQWSFHNLYFLLNLVYGNIAAAIQSGDGGYLLKESRMFNYIYMQQSSDIFICDCFTCPLM